MPKSEQRSGWKRVAAAGLLLALCLAAALPAAAEGSVQRALEPGVIINPSFETGDLSGWEYQDADPAYIPMQVGEAGFEAVDSDLVPLVGQPSDGRYALYTGWDGAPGMIRLWQPVLLPTGKPVLLFDYRAGWNRIPYGDVDSGGAAIQGVSRDRHFGVLVKDLDGRVLGDQLILTMPGAETGPLGASTQSYGPVEPDTGLLVGTVDLSAFAGQAVIIEFLWTVPDGQTGPALFQLDNIRLVQPGNHTRTDISVIVYGGWNDIPARLWVGGTEQETLYTATNSFGDAQAMWTLYPTGAWPVSVDVQLPAGLDPDQWELKLVRVSSPTLGYSNDEPGAAAATIMAGQQVQFVYQLISK